LRKERKKERPKKSGQRLTKWLAASVNKIAMSMKSLREAGEDLIEGKSLQPNTSGLQIH
jgi:hypothetical protein